MELLTNCFKEKSLFLKDLHCISAHNNQHTFTKIYSTALWEMGVPIGICCCQATGGRDKACRYFLKWDLGRKLRGGLKEEGKQFTWAQSRISLKLTDQEIHFIIQYLVNTYNHLLILFYNFWGLMLQLKESYVLQNTQVTLKVTMFIFTI